MSYFFKNFIFSGFLVVFVSSGCGQEAKEKAKAAAEKVQETAEDVKDEVRGHLDEPQLMTSWRGRCEPSHILEKGQVLHKHSHIQYYTFGGNDFDHYVVVHGTPHCNYPLFTIHYQGRMELKGDVFFEPEGQAKEINMHYEKVFIEPLHPEGARALNSAAFCGISSWGFGQPYEVTAQSADENCKLRKVPSDRHDLVQLLGEEKNELIFGQNLQGDPLSSPDKRPKKTDEFFKLQEVEGDRIPKLEHQQ